MSERQPQAVDVIAANDTVHVTGVAEMRGHVLTSDDRDLRLRVGYLRTTSGTAVAIRTKAGSERSIDFQRDETVVSIPFAPTSSSPAPYSVSERRLSSTRTGFLVGALGAALAFVVYAASHISTSVAAPGL